LPGWPVIASQAETGRQSL